MLALLVVEGSHKITMLLVVISFSKKAMRLFADSVMNGAMRLIFREVRAFLGASKDCAVRTKTADGALRSRFGIPENNPLDLDSVRFSASFLDQRP